MNRSWITALTLAGVVGSGGAFAGVVAATRDTPATALAPRSVLPAALVEPTTPALAATGTIAYQVGAVGTVTLSVANNAMTLAGVVTNAGWTAVSTSGTGAHAEAQFTDVTQLVTFSADLVGDNVVVSVTNAAVPNTTAAADASTTARSVPAVTPIAPPATNPVQTAPPAAVTTPSRSDDGHETETEDHEDHEDHETEHDDD
ncbi:MAG TPA: hypothetical protein VH761_16680 [Ilumatobacteraceae bacterium]|jgi:hypothetical protein